MVQCCAYGCKSRHDRKEPGITFHRFPRNSQRANIWAQNMRIADWTPSVASRICSKHFEKSLFYKVGERVRLLDDAAPTLFSELPVSVQPEKAIKRHASERSSDQLDVQLAILPGTSTEWADNITDSPKEKNPKKQLFQAVVKIEEKSRKIRVLRQKLKRYKEKILSLKNIVKGFQSKGLLSSENVLVLESKPKITKELLKCKSGRRKQYFPDLRKFAIILSFFSPKSYDYIRQMFDTCLPHQSTIGKWLKNVNAIPGFINEAFEVLK